MGWLEFCWSNYREGKISCFVFPLSLKPINSEISPGYSGLSPNTQFSRKLRFFPRIFSRRQKATLDLMFSVNWFDLRSLTYQSTSAQLAWTIHVKRLKYFLPSVLSKGHLNAAVSCLKVMKYSRFFSNKGKAEPLRQAISEVLFFR